MIVAYARTNIQTTLQIITCYLLNNSDFVKLGAMNFFIT